MAGQVSKENLGSVLMQAMLATKNIRPLRDRLLQLRRRFQQLSPGDDDAARVQELASDIFRVYFISIEAGSRILSACLKLIIENGDRIPFNTALAVIPDEQQYDVLLAQPLPARSTTQIEAFSLVEAAFNAIKLAQEHHMPRCIELLIGERPRSLIGDSPRVSSMLGYSDDPVAAATEHIAKNGLPNLAKKPPAAIGTRKATAKAPQAASTIDVDQALTYLHRACTLASLAVSHIDLAIAVFSSFLDPKEVASLSDFTDSVGYVSEDGKRGYHQTESD